MVNKPRILLATSACVSLVFGATMPTLGASYAAAEPEPLKQGQLVRLADIATTQNATELPAVAIGWRTGSRPGNLFMSYSTDGGATYLRGNGKLRQWAVAGDGNRGLSLAVCRDDVWAGSAARFPGDRSRDTDVLVTRRAIGGKAAQVFVTAPSARRTVRDVQVACVGTKLLAIAWLEKADGKTRARLMLRSLNDLAPAATNKTYFLGTAVFGAGITLATTSRSVHVAWTAGQARNVRYKRFILGKQANPKVTPKPVTTIAKGKANKPQLAVQGRKVVAAYTDGGKVDLRISKDLGATFEAPQTLIDSGSSSQPSRVHSVDTFGQRIVVEATRNAAGTNTAQRHESTNLGEDWDVRDFGHNGPRMGALRKSGPGTSALAETWLDNGVNDTLRAQYETP